MRGGFFLAATHAAAVLTLLFHAALAWDTALAAAPEVERVEANAVEIRPDNTVSTGHGGGAGLSALPAYIRKRWGVDLDRAEEVVAAAQTAAAKTAVDPLLLLAVVAKESKFSQFGNPKHLKPNGKADAIDPLAPHGPMQVAGRWHRDKMPRDSKGRIRPTSLTENIVTGALVLREYLESHGGNLRRALQQYNGCRRRNCDRYPNQVLEVKRELERAARRGGKN